jgi:hypothetical protein
MDFMGTLLWVMLVPAGLASLYGLHRLGLWMEQRGWLYYWHKKPGAGARSFVALQEFLEPPVQHVYHIKEQQRSCFEERVPGGDDPPPKIEGPERSADPQP